MDCPREHCRGHLLRDSDGVRTCYQCGRIAHEDRVEPLPWVQERSKTPVSLPKPDQEPLEPHVCRQCGGVILAGRRYCGVECRLAAKRRRKWAHTGSGKERTG